MNILLPNNKIITLKDIQREKARRKLIDFTTYTKPDYEVNWHHRNIAAVLDRFVKKEIKRVMIFTPPRHGKSELVSRRLPAYIFGVNPDARIIATSYSASLAYDMSNDTQRIIDSKEYHDLFPDTTLSNSEFTINVGKGKRYARTSEKFEIVGFDGRYIAAGVGGPIIGKGADYAIIDDPHKNRAEAESQVYRKKIFDWFASTLYTRLEKDACILITLTRWHEDDLAGQLLRLARENPDADQWYVVNYPAIFDDRLGFIDPTDPRANGEALWRGKYDEERLRAIKSTIGSYEWNALYQQTPTPPQGSIFRREWFQFYRKAPAEFDEIIQSWDFTFKDLQSSDFVVGQVWGRKGADRYLLDQVRDRMSFTASINAILTLSAKWPRARAKVIEDRANGPAIINALKRHVSGLIPYNPQGSKLERAYAVTPFFEAGNVHVPHPSIATWVHDYIEEMVAFPHFVTDDVVDATSQALIRLDRTTDRNKIKASVL